MEGRSDGDSGVWDFSVFPAFGGLCGGSGKPGGILLADPKTWRISFYTAVVLSKSRNVGAEQLEGFRVSGKSADGRNCLYDVSGCICRAGGEQVFRGICVRALGGGSIQTALSVRQSEAGCGVGLRDSSPDFPGRETDDKMV